MARKMTLHLVYNDQFDAESFIASEHVILSDRMLLTEFVQQWVATKMEVLPSETIDVVNQDADLFVLAVNADGKEQKIRMKAYLKTHWTCFIPELE